MRKLATIQKIDKILPIPNADNIELAVVKGWNVVVKKGMFRKNSLCIFCEVDSILPEKPEFEFLKDKNYRVKVTEIKGQISQGLCLPINLIQFTAYDINKLNEKYEIGYDVTEYLGIKKYIPKEEKEETINFNLSIKGEFPNFIPKTDLEKLQNIPEIFKKYNKHKIIITEKINGISFTAYFKNGELGYCSKNLELKDDISNEKTVYYKVFQRIKPDLYLIHNLIGNFAIQGEIIGPSVQKNYYCYNNYELFVFDIYLIDTKKYLSSKKIIEIIRNTSFLNKMVPIITIYRTSSIMMVDFLTKKAQGESLLNPSKEREGIVCNIEDNINNNKHKIFNFKVISNKYLLQNDI